ncbi:MAG: tRNA guanosine(34) transglycosylase Tgt [Chloroflexota bacterium]
MGVRFEIVAAGPGPARVGRLLTPHGEAETPALVIVATQASVKGLTPEEVQATGTQIVLANTYHLYLRPGADLVARMGGLHRFMGWAGPLMTDSGGFQVFSLGFALEHGVGKIAKTFPGIDVEAPAKGVKPGLVAIDDDGVTFTSHLDGSRHRFTPEKSIKVQEKLGADIIFAFDECTSPLHDFEYTRRALERTHRWALRCLAARTRSDQALFGIVQGGAYRELREASARFIGSLPFDGYGIGGSLGRSKAEMWQVVGWVVPLLPEGKPRHLLGIGEPEDLLEGIAWGIDLFDCVAPTRLGRHGAAYTRRGRLNLRAAGLREDPEPIEAGCDCYTCRRFSRAYLRHLFNAGEMLGPRLVTIHNIRFLQRLVEGARAALRAGALHDYIADFLASYRAGAGAPPG